MVNPEGERVLRLVCELRLSPGLPRNVYRSRLGDAVGRLGEALRAAAPIAFPWASELRIDAEWVTRRWSGERTLTLPETELNGPSGRP